MKTDQDLEHIEELKNLGVNVVLGSHPDDLFNENRCFNKESWNKDSHKYSKSKRIKYSCYK